MLNLTIDFTILIIAIIIGLIVSVRPNPRYLKLLPFFLLLALLTELAGKFWIKPGTNNTILFNFFSVGQVMYFCYFFSQILQSVNKKILLTISYGVPLLCVLNICFFQGFHTFHTYTYTFSSLVIVGLGITYFYQLFKLPENLNLLHTPSFWVCIAIVFYSAASISMMGIINYVSILSKQVIRYSHTMLITINALFYCLFIIAFLCQKNSPKSTHKSSPVS